MGELGPLDSWEGAGYIEVRNFGIRIRLLLRDCFETYVQYMNRHWSETLLRTSLPGTGNML
jgi:hypothetical protein